MSMRLMTWLAPSIPLGFYERIASTLSAALHREVSVAARYDSSGPVGPRDDPFASGEVDVGFLCAPSWAALSATPRPSVSLLELAPVFADPRNAGRPLYHCDLVVRADSPVEHLSDLRGQRFGFNDPVSLSGWHGIASRLRSEATTPRRFFSSLVCTGSHPASLQALSSGRIDAATVDSTLLLLRRRHDPASLAGLRLVEGLGPYPVQPIVVAAAMPVEVRRRIRQALAEAGPWPEFALERFGPQSARDFERVPRPCPDRVGVADTSRGAWCRAHP